LILRGRSATISSLALFPAAPFFTAAAPVFSQEPMAPELYDVIILGAGPVGMYAAYYAGFRKLKTKVVDSLDEVGGQVTALYPEKGIYDVAGFPEVRGKDLVQNLWRQMMQYHPTVCLGEQVQDLKRLASGDWELTTSKAVHHTKTVIITSGLGLMTPRKLENPAFERFEGHGLEYVMKDSAQYTGKNVVVIGGGDSAVDWSNHLTPIAQTVYVVHRRDEFRAHEHSVERMRQTCSIQTPCTIKDIQGGHHVERVVLSQGPSGAEVVIEAGAVLAFLGFQTTPGPIANWGITMEKSEILIDRSTETNLPGVFAAGDCAVYKGKVKLITVGFGEAAIAVNHAAVFVDPKRRVFPGHSSNAK
jgi:thioredoxin reductase (NADPH)